MIEEQKKLIEKTWDLHLFSYVNRLHLLNAEGESSLIGVKDRVENKMEQYAKEWKWKRLCSDNSWEKQENKMRNRSDFDLEKGVLMRNKGSLTCKAQCNPQ